MTLADLFVTLNAAGVTLALAADGKLSLRPGSLVTPALAAAAAEHKPTLLDLLAPDDTAECQAIAWEGQHSLPELAGDLERAIAEFDSVLAEDGWSIAKGQALAEKAVALDERMPSTELQRRVGDMIDQAYVAKNGPALVFAATGFAELAKAT